ncbi:FecR family protein [Chitinophaga sancti]|uniref:FecR domain-containing protein n=1 Tax=Chitinophaga sancti TaxID=1004 RepID=A0A1K1SBD8_9BACT|nr:FecR family protein [Chitinophaga sancti]WQD63550.1 FecR domain-containing protein [Chitinophaga sancti]WQG90824.1 FecR domain-containing protein [Chitinophaga sancti]SFW81683.1 FecR family protein [Chitinophaga sancti]
MDTSSDKAAIISLLKKYRAGAATPEEAARIREWFDSFEALQDDPALTDAANDAALEALERMFHPKVKVRVLPRILKIAAVLILVCTAFLFIYKQLHQSPVPITYASLQAGKGARKKITLPDGSIVTINANSELRIPSNFGVNDRVLELTGEAVFDVAKNNAKPFIVRSGNLQTVVLGTSFNVKAYPGDNDVQIAVLTGKVRIEKKAATQTTVLSAGLTKDQVLTYNATKDSLNIGTGKSAEIAAWQNNVFYFEKAGIAEIAAVLERQYNIHITLTGPAKSNCRYTLQLKNETIENAMRLLAELSGITYQIDHNEIKINSASCE